MPLEGRPAAISQKSVTANANRKETRGNFFEWMSMEERLHYIRWINSFLDRGNGLSFNESTAYQLIYNMFFTKQYFWI